MLPFAPFGYDKRELTCLLWNVEGFISLMKTPEICLLEQDMLILTETFLREPVTLPGYYAAHSLAAVGPEGRPSGGVSCLFRPSMGQVVDEYAERDVVIVTFEHLIVIGMYIRPTATTEFAIETILHALERAGGRKPILLGGDFNCRKDKPDRKAVTVFETLEEEGFSLVNEGTIPTYVAHNGSSVIDLVFYRGKEIRISRQDHLWTPIRKHIPVQTGFTLKGRKTTVNEQQAAPRHIDPTLLSGLLDEAAITQHLTEGNTDSALSLLETALLNSTLKTKAKRKSKPWFDEECYILRKETLGELHRWRELKSDINLARYTRKRREYQNLLNKKRTQFAEKKELELIADAEAAPYRILQPRRAKVHPQIPMSVWEDHFSAIYQRTQMSSRQPTTASNEGTTQLTTEEVWAAFQRCKRNKAPGPDHLTNEILQESLPATIVIWTSLFNECFRQGKIPDRWRESSIHMLYKGKGPKDSPDSYRGIALECNPFKVLSRILLNRITPQAMPYIPEQQFGFIAGRSTTQSIERVLDTIWEATATAGGYIYAIFIDYVKAFDGVDRTIMVDKLRRILGEENPNLPLIENILRVNLLTVSDKVSHSRPITQTNGVLQGDPLSPMMFNLLTHDVIQEVAVNLPMFLYADDMVMMSSNREALQEGLNRLHVWSRRNGLDINTGKTKVMKFRKGGNVSRSDIFTYGNEKLEIVNSYKYLGLTLQVTGKSFTKHIEERCSAAIKATYDIKKLEKLSTTTALRLFYIKIAPIVSYALKKIWVHLTSANLKKLEAVKASYLKRALQVSRTTQTRLVYLLMDTDFFVRELMTSNGLQPTPAYEAHVRDREEKAADVDQEFLQTPAMNTEEWKKPNFELRHVFTRTAAHGFHHRICAKRGYHSASEQCICTLCGHSCSQYHILTCQARTETLTFYAKEGNF